MSIEIKTASVEPLRQTFDHLKEMLGEGKQPTRYQEGVHGFQPEVNFHYRPTWDPEFEMYDPRRTALVMESFEKLIDPRQYYYGTYTIQRARQQDSQEANFSFVEKRDLFATVPAEALEKIKKLVLPLRHAEWGANTNNCYIAAYGFGAPITSAATFQMTDHLGNAQYITRIGLALANNDTAVLDNAKEDWLNDPMWQPLRQLIEDAMVVKDWFELHVLQNFLLDGAIHVLVFDHFDRAIATQGGTAFAMLTEFTVDWFAEAKRWTDATIKVAGGESDANKALLQKWLGEWTPRVRAAVTPLAEYAFADAAEATLDSVFAELDTRAAKIGIA